ncbi:MAG: calcium-binding protein, partial [Schwartzia sp.]|nr:calcium-binding protein [Schwartzia sp. (in: firmicutes)]
INYKIPSTVPVTISNAAVGSSISGIKQNNGKAAGDLITSADEKSRALAKGTVSLYRVVDVDVDADNKADVKRTVETKVTYAPSTTKGDSAVIDAVSGEVKKLTGLDRNGEKVTIAETTEKGAQTTIYEVKTVSKVQYVYKTVTDIDGTKKTYRGALGASGYDWIGDTSKLLELVSTDVVAEFDWTMSKNSTGYFAVSTSSKGVVSSTLRAQTKAVTIKDTDKNKYIAVKISGDGVVESVRSVMKNAETGEMIDADTKFSGTLNVKAPVKISLDFDRTKLDGTTIDSASALAVTGAIAGSKLTNLALGDTVTTAKLAKNTETVSLSAAGDGNGVQTFTAGTAGALSFKVRTVDGSAKLSLTGGTVKLDTGDYVYTGDRMITMEKGSVTVTAKTGTNGATYTIGNLKEGAVFTVETFGDGACLRKYMRSANNLFCEIVKNGGTTMAVYEIKTATSAASSVLEQAGVASVKNSKWTNFTESNATFRETDDGLKLVSTAKNAAVTVDLNLLDKRIASDNKTAANQGDNDDYSFIIDKYMANPTKFNGAAAVVADGNLLDLQQVIGTRAGGNKIYTAAGVDIAQTIKVTKEWHVIGSNRNDTITGASSGSDTLEGGAGNDLLTGGVASDKFIVGLGKDTIKSYVTNKDSVSYQDDQGQVKDFNVILTDSDVLLWSDDDEDGSYGAGDSSVLVVGMGNRKALNINGVNYYFGSAKVKKAETFSFDAGSAEQAATSRYYGKAGLANTLSIGTTKAMATKNTLGDTVTADLSDGTRYANISIADASKSGNRVDLKAAAAGSTLKGGTYQTTMRGGAGNDSLVGGGGADTFWFDTVEKDDVVTGYTSGKDSVYLGNVAKATAEEIDGLTIAAVGNDVVISSGETGKVTLKKAVSATKAVTVLADEKGMNKLSYYVGKTGSYDKKGNPTGKNGFKATLGKDTADSVAGATAGTFTSYYVGSDSSVDTLTLVGADKKTAVGSETAAATFDMASANLASIDVLDASGLAAGSYLRLVGKAAGTYSLIGSSKATKETFDLKAVKTTDATSVTVKGLDLADVIEIAAGVKATRDDTKSTKTNTYFKLTDSKDATKVYGEILVSGVGKGNFGTEYSAGTIQRSK